MQRIKKAVALKYPEGAAAPFVTVTAKGELAQKVLDAAEENDITIVKNDELTDFLSVQEIGTCVPETVWPVLAKIFAFVMQQS
ncbi:MAG: EscU/YscU/HrcU family type III secretion system export apparatus switch protein [Treponema sp.]|uniref:EscU/YscU/HrcU family type III secretion system export apparatus switch protein n=1 Tax=Treponema sp. TaxID=166 RepID=UPI00298E055A|nr:EscU/YscU/HrcU family type III secretion system export apparatus switch protein [Treponema sp.]MCI5696762.1 EscU/YscU/HrcU family type III secretion system export apparatus switch protein [Spirochaetia bacterium]MDD5812075.1 EscU/YscU/HrcU family type III secretion system export apparatus switch protein [Treponema sp.]MDY5884688.1 EscU/YscU/HrcU family type III secretion system export apparatus switch protein [Treponema sp.]